MGTLAQVTTRPVILGVSPRRAMLLRGGDGGADAARPVEDFLNIMADRFLERCGIVDVHPRIGVALPLRHSAAF